MLLRKAFEGHTWPRTHKMERTGMSDSELGRVIDSVLHNGVLLGYRNIRQQGP